MPNKGYPNNFSNGVVLDISEQKVPENAAIFIKNLTQNVNTNVGAPSGSGFNVGEWTPLEGNVSLEADIPEGSFTIGSFYSQQTNEMYFFTYNPDVTKNGVWLVDAAGQVLLVYMSSYLPFSLNARYFISEGRCTMELRSINDPETGIETDYKFLIFTNGADEQFSIEVRSSIATSSFTTPSNITDRFYNPGGLFYNPKELAILGVPTPLSNIKIVPISSTPADLILQNNIVREGYQFRVKNIDIFGRESEHGIISDNYISGVGGGCIQSANGQPRCVNIVFGAGNALVQHIVIEFRQWVGDDRGGAIATNWKEYETISKYVGFGIQWWDQKVDTSGTSFLYSTVTNEITYTFCGDKTSIAIDPFETARTQPGIPRTSDSSFSVGKEVGLANNVYGFDPIDPAQLAKIQYSTTIPPATCPAPPTTTVQFYMAIYDVGHPSGDGIYDVIKDGDTFGFGNPALTSTIQNADQIFGDQDNPGFIFYVAGQPQYNCITERGALDSVTQVFTPLPIGTANPNPGSSVIVQRATLLVPASRGLIRAASHKVKRTDNNFQTTSTYVGGIGVVNDLFTSLDGYANNPLKEILFDSTSGSYVSNQLFIVLDMSRGARAMGGYLREDSSINSGQGIEMQPVLFGGGTPDVPTVGKSWGSYLTDHNGFYFATTVASGQMYVRMDLDVCDGAGTTKTILVLNNVATMLYGLGTGTTASGSGSGTLGNYLNIVSYYVGTLTYPSPARITIDQKEVLCGTTTGVPGIPVAMTKGGTDTSNNDGVIKVISHNRYDYNTVYAAFTLPYNAALVPDYSAGSGNEDDNLVFSQKGGCTWVVCGDCGAYSRVDVLVPYSSCTSSNRITHLDSLEFQINGYNIKGVQSGGRYSIGVILYDIIGRHTFVQLGIGDTSFVNVANINDITSMHPFRTFALSSLAYQIASDFQVPSTFVAMTFAVTANLVFSDFFSWAADWVQAVDNSGNNNSANPTQLRIYYQSLNEYNKQNNFNTNTGWEFQTTGVTDGVTVTTPMVGDIIQFLMNGDGSWITAPLTNPVSYDKNGAFISVEYTNAMASITNGALFRVIRPKQLSTNNIYYEQNLVIPLVNGRIINSNILSGTIPYYDSYMLNRSLPVPILKGQPGAIPPGQQAPNPIQYSSSGDTSTTDYVTNNIANNNNVVQMSLVDAATSFPFFFESPSPSDFWGSHLANRGRVHTNNPYEAEYRLGTEFIISAALGTRPNSFNGMSYFESKNAKIFDRNQYGNIVAVLVETGTCLVICQADHFTTMYNQSTVYVTSEGTVNAQNTDGSLFTNPIKKIGQDFGCRTEDINTIRSYQGIVYWLDSKGRLVQCDYNNAKDVSLPNAYYGWLLNKISFVKILEHNPDTVLSAYFIGGIDPKTNEYILGSVNIPPDLTPQYINESSEPNILGNDTLLIDILTGSLKSFASFTPEYYGMFPGFDNQKNMFSFKGGTPWKHHTAFGGVAYNNFYGIQTPAYVSGVVNVGVEVVKRYMWMEVYCNATTPIEGGFGIPIFYVDEKDIITERGQQSRLLTPQWSFSNGFAKAPFLCASNTPPDPNLPVQTGANVIRDGDNLQGRWLQYTLRTNDNYAGEFFKLTSVIVFVNQVKKSGG